MVDVKNKMVVEMEMGVKMVDICDLFPLSGGLSRDCFFYEFTTQNKLYRRILDAVTQIFSQTTKRHRRLAIEDDEFFHADKVQKIEQARKNFRTGTRLNQPVPKRKSPMSTLLKPLTLSTEPKLVFKNYLEPFLDKTMPYSFPGSVPQSLMKNDITKLYDGAYFFVWARKTNGLSWLMVACTYGHEKMLLFINRAQQIT